MRKTSEAIIKQICAKCTGSHDSGPNRRAAELPLPVTLLASPNAWIWTRLAPGVAGAGRVLCARVHLRPATNFRGLTPVFLPVFVHLLV